MATKLEYETLSAKVRMLSENVQKLAAATETKKVETIKDLITDEKGRNIVALYSCLLDISIEKCGELGRCSFSSESLDLNKTIREISYICYAYAGGKGEYNESLSNIN